MESCSNAGARNAQQSTEASSAFTEQLGGMNAFGLTHHSSVSDSTSPAALLQGKGVATVL